MQSTLHDGQRHQGTEARVPLKNRGAVLRACLCAGAVAASLVTAGPATADEAPDKVACAHSYEQAQRLRRAQQLRASREELRVCSRVECPATLRKECAQWLLEVDGAIPTIIVVARGADGRPASDVRIRIDGELVADQATRAAIPLEPGTHVVRFDAPGAPAIEEHVTLRAGDRDRRIDVTFGATRAGAEQSTSERPVPPLVYALGAGGLLALGIGGYFQIDGMSSRQDLYGCAPRCAQGDVDDARRSLWIGNIGLGVGVVALVAATVLYFTRP